MDSPPLRPRFNRLKASVTMNVASHPSGNINRDPSIGLGGGIPTLYFIVGGVAVAGLLAVVAIRRRHPQVQKDSKQN